MSKQAVPWDYTHVTNKQGEENVWQPFVKIKYNQNLK